jgi:hypothetical protein
MLADLHILIFLFAIIFCPGLTFTIWLHNKFLSLVFQSAFVRADDFQISAQRKALTLAASLTGQLNQKWKDDNSDLRPTTI